MWKIRVSCLVSMLVVVCVEDSKVSRLVSRLVVVWFVLAFADCDERRPQCTDFPVW